MKNTNTAEFRKLMFQYLEDSVCDDEGVIYDQRDAAQRIKDRFTAEFDHAYERKRTPNEHDRIAEWLSGLPLDIDYSNGDIIERIEEWHEVTLTDTQCDKYLDGWWRFMAMQVLKMWKHHGVTRGNPDWYADATDPDESDILREFESEILPFVIEQYGPDDEPAMNEAFCNWTDSLEREGRISRKMCDNIVWGD